MFEWIRYDLPEVYCDDPDDPKQLTFVSVDGGDVSTRWITADIEHVHPVEECR